MSSRLIIVLLILFVYLLTYVALSYSDETVGGQENACDHSFSKRPSIFSRFLNTSFLKKFFTHLNPFTDDARVSMHFYLYKYDFPDCGREIKPYVDETLMESGFNAEHPTRVIIHGWMSQSRGGLNRAVKNAYLTLASMNVAKPLGENETNYDVFTSNVTDFNVVLVDWSVISTNVNYSEVVELMDVLGFMLAEFLRYLHERAGLNFNDLYLIGHSLGAQMAGSAGMQLKPLRINTIFALDPAGPKFRDVPPEKRIDPTDAEYVESIQTSSSLGLRHPVGHATFYPNFGRDQKNCRKFGCSHSRAHRYFAESITSREGFWGTRCERQSDGSFFMFNLESEYRMGGEPSRPKLGTFYVPTRSSAPFAMGRRATINQD